MVDILEHEAVEVSNFWLNDPNSHCKSCDVRCRIISKAGIFRVDVEDYIAVVGEGRTNVRLI